MIDGALRYDELEEFERGLAALKSITPLLNADELPEHLAAIKEIQATLDNARAIQAACNHAGWCRSDSLDLACGDCGASLFTGKRSNDEP